MAGKESSPTAALGCGCVVLGLGLTLFMAGIFAYTSVVAEQTWFPPGDPAHFDPVAGFGRIQSHAGAGARLLAFEARFVRADGTLDLGASFNPPPSVEYTFARELPGPPKNAPPIGAGRGADDHWYEPIRVTVTRPWQLRSASRTSGGIRSRYQYFDLGMARDVGRPQAGPEATFAPRPACPLRDLWKLAEGLGAPGGAVAVIRYDSTGYSFRIEGTPIDLAFGLDCAPVPRRPSST